MDVTIIGGGGHVGLPLGLVMGDAGHHVTLVDTDEERLATIERGSVPFDEPGAEQLLADVQRDGRLQTTTSVAGVEDADAIVVVLGTPIDEHHNPQMTTFLEIINEVTDHLSKGQLLTFRSTVYPGTTAIVRERLAERGYAVGEDIYLSFAPERVAQHNAVEEVVRLPQLVGAFDDRSYERTAALYKTFNQSHCLRLSPTEAELGKLFTNMWRYLTFAAANEFYLVADSFNKHYDVNIHRILDKTAEGYPRFDVPSPGANVGGPCLTKDGWFLVDNIPYNELVSAAYQINEGIPSRIIDRMATLSPDPSKISILGMTFKAGSDDTRNSVAFKLTKQLTMKGYHDLVRVEPNLDSFDTWEDVKDSDWIILMTPHEEFDNLKEIRSAVGNDDCLVCDIWGNWEPMRHRSNNGYFFLGELDELEEDQ